ncbi:hypothetical protein [Bythopirellula goksoeyrii]|uniref:Uncharacterized protein n=1 Tax=Bythopirellula goksoeyrii TaxID=1400387 RepID=A0A5B9Q9K9_9BACT|nr:hypothetical protein [Bythopirellula goksoeyrii]QEG35724.1 hypothetical protein Pr1d_30270 [Bythopirellula goksoeyrii]
MSTLEIQEIEDDFFSSVDDAITFERIRHHRDGRMPVGSSAAAIRSSRRKQPWRRSSRKIIGLVS